MHRVSMAVAVAALATAPILTAPIAGAASVDNDITHTQPSVAAVPKVAALDCHGTTGNMGCGPGWFWRDGWRGWACYPC
jgi:hypothetical protein